MNDLVGRRGSRNRYGEGKRPGAVVKQFRALLLHSLLPCIADMFVLDSSTIFLLVWFVFYEDFFADYVVFYFWGRWMSRTSGVTLLIGRKYLFTSLEPNKCAYSNPSLF